MGLSEFKVSHHYTVKTCHQKIKIQKLIGWFRRPWAAPPAPHEPCMPTPSGQGQDSQVLKVILGYIVWGHPGLHKALSQNKTERVLELTGAIGGLVFF